MLKPLPTTTASFRKMIEGNYLYIDKTEYIYQLVQNPTGAWFLSRPRRFGKSLLISTLEELFQGNRDLFRGLWIDRSDYNWESYPVIRIGFNLYPTTSAAELKANIIRYLQLVARQYGVTLADSPYYVQFSDLIFALSAQKPVVILIDEYDKPLIDNLGNLAEAQEIRETLKAFYGVIKALEGHIRLAFITGISKFSKVSIFSDLNSLGELTSDERFANMLGITQTELDLHFQARIVDFAAQQGVPVDELRQQIRRWYNGFRFTQWDEALYNPFSIMNLFDKLRFHNYWFDSGTPTFLVKLIQQRNYALADLNNLVVGELAFSTYDIERLSIIPLLFQTGYLTIKEYLPATRQYRLHYPNYEVENSFLVHLLDAFSNTEQGLSESHLWRLIGALRNHNLHEFFAILRVLFANIDYDLHRNYEKYYQTIFYLIFKLIGLQITAEVRTNDGRIDAVVEIADQIYIFEFKLDESAAAALQQIKDREYYQRYRLHGKPIICVGANFNSTTRTVDGWETLVSAPL